LRSWSATKALDFLHEHRFREADRRSNPDGPRFLTIGVPGQDFELVLWPGTPAKAELGSAVYTVEVDDCRATFDMLASRSVKFEPAEVLQFP
jgi:hypothetical protein